MSRNMLQKKLWATGADGTIEYVSVTEDLIDKTIELMHNSLYVNENACIAFGLPNRKDAFGEMDSILRDVIITDNVSIVAVEKATGNVVGVAVNKIQTVGGPTLSAFEKYMKNLKPTSPVFGILNWIIEIENSFNVFEKCQVDCLMEIMFMTVNPDYRQRGIATKIVEVSIDLAKHLKYNLHSDNQQQYVHDKQLIPQVVTGILTTFVTQRITKQLNFIKGIQVDYDKFVVDESTGKTMKDVVGHHTPYVTYEYFIV